MLVFSVLFVALGYKKLWVNCNSFGLEVLVNLFDVLLLTNQSKKKTFERTSLVRYPLSYFELACFDSWTKCFL